MKRILIICFLCSSLAGFSQIDRVKKQAQVSRDSLERIANADPAKKKAMDSLSLVLQTDLKIKKEKADLVLAIIEESIGEMNVNAKNRGITNEEKTTRFKQIAMERDKKIAAQLTEKQVEQLQAIMLKNRQRNGK
jgi:hypothetical protein